MVTKQCPARILVKLTRRIALLDHLPECQITGLGSSSGQEAAVAASRSVAGTLQRPGMLQGQDQERCSAQERCRGRNDQTVTKQLNLAES
jgi:hypothetical protein